MDLIKKLTGKNPAEYEAVAKSLVDNSDVALFAKLVKQDDFLFDFVKNYIYSCHTKVKRDLLVVSDLSSCCSIFKQR